MESHLFEIDRLTARERGNPGGGTPAATDDRFIDSPTIRESRMRTIAHNRRTSSRERVPFPDRLLACPRRHATGHIGSRT